jgi:hypothetical protein
MLFALFVNFEGNRVDMNKFIGKFSEIVVCFLLWDKETIVIFGRIQYMTAWTVKFINHILFLLSNTLIDTVFLVVLLLTLDY